MQIGHTLSATALLALTGTAQAAIFFSESFETDGAGSRYFTSVPEFTDLSTDYFTRTDGSNIASTASYVGADGDFFFAAQDIDGEVTSSQQTLRFTGINISGFENIEFGVDLAEDDDSGNEDWDVDDFVLFEYSIDGGALQSLLAIESVPDGDSFNAVPAIDTDFDGNGDGTEITDTFHRFVSAIAGTGSLLDLQITFDLDARDEDLAIDNLTLAGDFTVVPVPAAVWLLGSAMGVVGFSSRRRG